jgi:hypothetical protein
MNEALMRFLGRVKQYLEERDYRPLFHLICVAVIVSFGCFLFYKNFVNPGMMMSTDMTWPDTLARLQFRTVNTWYPFGSTPATSAIQWFFWIYPSSMVARLFHLSAAWYMFLLFLGTFCLAGISMYALTFSTIKSMKLEDTARYAPYVGAVFAGLVYMYNPWSIHYLRPYFGYPIYALAPLLILAMVKVYKSPSLRNIILLVLLATIANTSHNQTWLFGLLFSYFLFYVAKNHFGKEALKTALKVFLGTTALYLLLNAIWTVPFLGAQLAGKPLLPYYQPGLNVSMLNGASSNSYMMNNLRMLSIWSWSIDQLGGGPFLQALTFGLPVFTLISLILVRKEARKNSIVNYLGVLAVVTLLLATGTSSVSRSLYRWLVFNAPGSSTFGWLLRSPERWLFFVAPFIALMLGILIARLLPARPAEAPSGSRLKGVADMLRYRDSGAVAAVEDAPDRLFDHHTTEERIEGVERSIASRRFRNSTIIAVLIIIVVLVSMYPKAMDFAKRVFSPANVPGDYTQVNDYLSKQPDTPRVAWMPFFPPQQFQYRWAPFKTITWFSVMTSNPSLSSVYEVMNKNSYFNWLQDLYLKNSTPDVTLENKQIMIGNNVLSRLLWPFSTKYFIFDTSAMGYYFNNRLLTDTSIKSAYSTNYLKAFSTDSDPGYIWAATRTLKANSFFDNLAFLQKLPALNYDNLAFTNGNSFFGSTPDVPERYGSIDLQSYLQTVNANPGFEEVLSDGTPVRWVSYGVNTRARITTDASTKVEGTRSLIVVNGASKLLGIARVISDEHVVQSGAIYTIDASIRYKNANWTNVSVEGFDSRLKAWIPIARCPVVTSGGAEWKSYHCAFLIPPEITKIRPILGAGWVRNPRSGKAVSWFDDVRISKVADSLYDRLIDRPAAPRITVKRLSAEKYKVQVRGARAPFMLIQSEAFDPLWVAKFADGTHVDATPMYATINGYRVNKTGDFDLVLQYQPQQFYWYGLVLTLMTLIFCIAVLLYTWKAEPGTLKRAARGGKRLAGKTIVRLSETGTRAGEPRTSGSRGPKERSGRTGPGLVRRMGRWLRSLLDRPDY